MAREKVVDQEKTQGKKKKGRTFLKICIVLAVLSALILGGWIFTSSIVFLRNAILFAGVSGIGVALAKPIVNKIDNHIAQSKSNKRNRNRNRDRNRKRDNNLTLGEVPVQKKSEKEDILEWTPITRGKKSSQNKNR